MKPHTAYAIRTLSFLLAIVAITAAGAWLTLPKANAETLGAVHMDTSKRICIEDHGWTRWNDTLPNVAWRLRAYAGINAVVWNDCSSQRPEQTISLRVIYTDRGICAQTRMASWPDGSRYGRTYIEVNMHPRYVKACHGSYSHRAHLMSHEVGHAFGLIHCGGASVMASWSYAWYTATDYRNLRSIY